MEIRLLGLDIVNSLWPSDAIWRKWTWTTVVQVMACHLFGTKPLPESTILLLIEPLGTHLDEIWIIKTFYFKKICFKMLSAILFKPQCVKP